MLAGRLPAHLVNERDVITDTVALEDRPDHKQKANDNQADLEPLHLSPRARTTVEIAFTILGFIYIALVIFQYYRLATMGAPDMCWEYGC